MMNETTRKAVWKSSITPDSWKIRIKIRNGKAFLLDVDGNQEVETPINCIKNGKIIFGDGGLLLTIITPLLNKGRGDPNVIKFAYI